MPHRAVTPTSRRRRGRRVAVQQLDSSLRLSSPGTRRGNKRVRLPASSSSVEPSSTCRSRRRAAGCRAGQAPSPRHGNCLTPVSHPDDGCCDWEWRPAAAAARRHLVVTAAAARQRQPTARRRQLRLGVDANCCSSSVGSSMTGSYPDYGYCDREWTTAARCSTAPLPTGGAATGTARRWPMWLAALRMPRRRWTTVPLAWCFGRGARLLRGAAPDRVVAAAVGAGGAPGQAARRRRSVARGCGASRVADTLVRSSAVASV